MIRNLNPEEALDIIFKHMQEKGLVQEEEREMILNNVIKHFPEDFSLTMEDLQNENVQKFLMGAIISSKLGNEADTKQFVDKLVEAQKNEFQEEPDPKLNKKLAAGILLLLAGEQIQELLHEKLKPNAPTPKPTPTNSAESKEKLENDAEKNELKSKMKQKIEMLAKQLEDTLRNLYGGEDPRMAGKIHAVVTYIVGNIAGFTHQSAANPNSLEDIVEEITYNPSKEDYLGLENIAKEDNLMSGIIDSIDNTFVTPLVEDSQQNALRASSGLDKMAPSPYGNH